MERWLRHCILSGINSMKGNGKYIGQVVESCRDPLIDRVSISVHSQYGYTEGVCMKDLQVVDRYLSKWEMVG